MGLLSTQLPAELRELADSTNSRLLSLDELCVAMKYSTEDCEQQLEPFVKQGILRRIITTSGEIYYWLVAFEMNAVRH